MSGTKKLVLTVEEREKLETLREDPYRMVSQRATVRYFVAIIDRLVAELESRDRLDDDPGPMPADGLRTAQATTL